MEAVNTRDLLEGSKEDIKDIFAMCYNDSALFAKLLFPDMFRQDFTSLHYQYFDFLDNSPAKYKAVIAPRGFAKTTMAKMIWAKKTLYKDKRFIGYVTNSGDIAVNVSDEVKTMLLTNPLIRKLFGDVSESKVEGMKEKWSEKAWIANSHTFMLPRGLGQQVNGLNWKSFRPDLWLPDDLEDRVEVRSEEQRKKVRNWFFGVLMYTASQYDAESDEFEIIYTDTIKHPDALMCHLMEDKRWEVLNLPVCDKNYKTLAPGFKSQETLDAEIEGHRDKGTMDIFAMEMMGKAQDESTKNFKPEWIKYYEENDEDFVNRVRPRLINILIWDPARTKNPKAADTGFVVWGLDLEYNAFYARICKGEKLTVAEQHEELIRLAQWYEIQALGVEVDGLEDHVMYPFINECQRRRLFWLPPRIIELRARSGKGELKGEEGGKEGRIAALFPFYEKGLVWHDKTGAARLEQQLLGSRLRDVADAAAYLPQMLIKGAKFMSPMANEDGSRVSDQAAYEALEKMNPPPQRNVFV